MTSSVTGTSSSAARPASRSASLSKISLEPTWIKSGGSPREIPEDRADLRVGRIRAAYVVRYTETEPFRREDRIARLSLENGLA